MVSAFAARGTPCSKKLFACSRSPSLSRRAFPRWHNPRPTSSSSATSPCRPATASPSARTSIAPPVKAASPSCCSARPTTRTRPRPCPHGRRTRLHGHRAGRARPVHLGRRVLRLPHEAQDGYDTIEWAARLAAVQRQGRHVRFLVRGRDAVDAADVEAAVLWSASAGDDPAATTTTAGATKAARGRGLRRILAAGHHRARLAATATRRDRPHERGDPGSAGPPTSSALQGTVTLAVRRTATVASYFYDWIKHTPGTTTGSSGRSAPDYDQVQVPALNFSGWYDVFRTAQSQLRRHASQRRQRSRAQGSEAGRRALDGHPPWPQKVGEVDFGPEAATRSRSRTCVVRLLADRARATG